MSKFTIHQRANGQYYFNLKANNGLIILMSEGYTSKSGCMNGILSAKMNGQDDRSYDKRTTSNGKMYFNIKAGNGMVIGTSQMFNNENSRDSAIEYIKNNINEASIIEDL